MGGAGREAQNRLILSSLLTTLEPAFLSHSDSAGASPHSLLRRISVTYPA